MELPKHTKHLDAILKILVQNSFEAFGTPLTISQIQHKLKENKSIGPSDQLYSQIMFLLKEGYISDNKDRVKGITIYSTSLGSNGEIGKTTKIKLDELNREFIYPTWEGVVFHDSGGYEGKTKKTKQETERIKKNERQLKILSWIAAIGAGGILLLEIIKFIVQRMDFLFCNC